MITLRQLRYLSALSRRRHFGRAAEACSVTQPALSMQVRELENEVGAQLVERRPGEVAFTAAGDEIVRRADHILALVRDLADAARHRKPLHGVLRLGIIPTVGPYLLPRLVPLLQRRHPQLRLEVRETQTRILLDELASGALDAVMVALPVEHPELETKPLFDDTFLLAVPDSDAVPRGRISAGDVDQRRLLLLEEGHCLRDQALAFCAIRQPGQDGTASLGATSLTTVMQMVAGGYGVTLVPNIAADTEAKGKPVKLLRFAAPEPSRRIGLAWRRTSPRIEDFNALAKATTLALK